MLGTLASDADFAHVTGIVYRVHLGHYLASINKSNFFNLLTYFQNKYIFNLMCFNILNATLTILLILIFHLEQTNRVSLLRLFIT